MWIKDLVVTACLLVLAGCGETSLQIIDAKTGEPIEGVKVTYEHYDPTRLIPGYETQEVHYADADGRVVMERSVAENKDHIALRHRDYEKQTITDARGVTVELQPRPAADLPAAKEVGVRLLELLSETTDK